MEDNEASRVRALGAILAEFELDMLRVKTGDAEYELVRREAQSSLPVASTVPQPPAGLNGSPAAAGPGSNSAPARALKVTAPVVGVFYRSATPGAEPFV